MKILWLNINLFVCLIFVFMVKKTNCDDWEYKLVHDLLRGYDSSIRPSVHHNVTLNVTFGLALAQLIDVDERNMIITTNCWLNQVILIVLNIVFLLLENLYYYDSNAILLIVLNIVFLLVIYLFYLLTKQVFVIVLNILFLLVLFLFDFSTN